MSDFWKSLRVTIVDAYSLEDLDMVLAEELSKNLRSTIQVGPMDLVVFQLLRAAKNQGWLVPLLEALKRRRPESQAFQLAMDRSIQVLNMPKSATGRGFGRRDGAFTCRERRRENQSAVPVWTGLGRRYSCYFLCCLAHVRPRQQAATNRRSTLDHDIFC